MCRRKPSAYDKYVNASKGKVQQKGKGLQRRRMVSRICDNHNCPKYHPRRQPGRCAICGSTRHYTSQCTRPVKRKAKNAECDEDSNWQAEAELQGSTWESMKLPKARKAKARDQRRKGSRRARALGDLLLQDLLRARLLEHTSAQAQTRS